MPTLIDQLDEAVNLARLQAQDFRNLAAAAGDDLEAARLVARAEALCELATKAASFGTPTARRRTLTLLLLNIQAAAGALEDRQSEQHIQLGIAQ